MSETEHLLDADEEIGGIDENRLVAERKVKELRQQLADLARRFAEAEAALEDHRETARAVLSETCAPDEQHCTCVPTLRAEVERLRGERDEAVKRAEAAERAVVRWQTDALVEGDYITPGMDVVPDPYRARDRAIERVGKVVSDCEELYAELGLHHHQPDDPLAVDVVRQLKAENGRLRDAHYETAQELDRTIADREGLRAEVERLNMILSESYETNTKLYERACTLRAQLEAAEGSTGDGSPDEQNPNPKG